MEVVARYAWKNIHEFPDDNNSRSQICWCKIEFQEPCELLRPVKAQRGLQPPATAGTGVLQSPWPEPTPAQDGSTSSPFKDTPTATPDQDASTSFPFKDTSSITLCRKSYGTGIILVSLRTADVASVHRGGRKANLKGTTGRLPLTSYVIKFFF